MEFLQYVILGFAPGVFWVWYLRHQGDLEPEPRHLVVWVFALGCLSTLPILWLRPEFEDWVFSLTEGWDDDFVDAFLITAPSEEIVKMLAFLLGIYWHRQLDEPLDGIIYGTAVGLGFASVENVIYIVRNDEPFLALTRGFTATLAHVATSGSLGFFVGLSRFRPLSRAPFLWLTGLAIAVVFLGVYDYFLFGGGPLAAIALVCLLPLMLVFLGLRIHWARARSGLFHRQGEKA